MWGVGDWRIWKEAATEESEFLKSSRSCGNGGGGGGGDGMSTRGGERFIGKKDVAHMRKNELIRANSS